MEKENIPVSKDLFLPKPKVFNSNQKDNSCISAENILEFCFDDDICILDARSEERYTGENETLDPFAGYIPSVVYAPHTKNVDENGNWKSKFEIYRIYFEFLGGRPVKNAYIFWVSNYSLS